MSRTTYVYRNGELVDKRFAEPLHNSDSAHSIMPDLSDFVSPVDGKVVHGRAGLREHDKRHGTTNVADYKETWAKRQRERERLFTGADHDRRRTDAVVRAFNDLQARSRR